MKKNKATATVANFTLAPSLLSANFLNLQEDLLKLEDIHQKTQKLFLHLDIMDGHYTQQLTFGEPLLKAISKTNLSIPLDAHLMVTNPDELIERFFQLKLPLHNVTVHVETVTHLHRTIMNIRSYFPSVGISFNPATPLSFIDEELFSLVDIVLLMSVNPGFSGQKFIPSTLHKIQQLRELREKRGDSFLIEVDGGVDASNANELTQAGADILVAGQAVFGQNQSIQDNIKKLVPATKW